MKNFFSRSLGCIGIGLLLVLITYVASYALFLKAAPDANSVYYRVPKFYRPVEWMIVKTPLQSMLLRWSECLDVRGRTEMQSYYFAQGISDPPEEIHFNFGPDGDGLIHE